MSDAHELLPWYVNGTLDEAERHAFEEHVKGCARCAQELPMLEELRLHVSEPGWDEHAEHPDPEALSRVVVEGVEDAAMRRHLALCLTCTEEARWLRGEEAAQAPPPRHPHVASAGRMAAGVPSRRGSGWAVPLVAAAAVLLMMVGVRVLWPGGGSGPVTGLGLPVLVPAAERDLGKRQEVPLPPGAPAVHTLFQVDLAPGEFPATFEVIDSGGHRIFTKADLGERDLFRGTFFFTCARADCPPGDYSARVIPAGARRPPVDYPFRIVPSR